MQEEGVNMKQVKIFESDDYEGLQTMVNNWIYQNGVTVINTSLSICKSGYSTYYYMSVLYEA